MLCVPGWRETECQTGCVCPPKSCVPLNPFHPSLFPQLPPVQANLSQSGAPRMAKVVCPRMWCVPACGKCCVSLVVCGLAQLGPREVGRGEMATDGCGSMVDRRGGSWLGDGPPSWNIVISGALNGCFSFCSQLVSTVPRRQHFPAIGLP